MSDCQISTVVWLVQTSRLYNKNDHTYKFDMSKAGITWLICDLLSWGGAIINIICYDSHPSTYICKLFSNFFNSNSTYLLSNEKIHFGVNNKQIYPMCHFLMFENFHF